MYRFKGLFDLNPILYAKFDLHPVFVIVRLCLSNNHKKWWVKSKDYATNIRHCPPLLCNSLRFPCMGVTLNSP